MAIFKDTAELYAIQGKFFDWITNDESMRATFVGTNTIFKIRYEEPTAQIVIDCTQDPPVVTCDPPSDLQSDIGLKMNADDGHRFWLGELSFTNALVRHKVSISGSMVKAVQLLPAMLPLFELYKTYLVENGYGDLTRA